MNTLAKSIYRRLFIFCLGLGYILTIVTSCTKECSECQCAQDDRCSTPQLARVCSVDPPSGHFCEERRSVIGAVRRIETNGLPNHKIGLFGIVNDTRPCGRPAALDPAPPREFHYFPITPGPVIPARYNSLPNSFGIAVNGVELDPLAAEYWSCDPSPSPDPRVGWMKNAPLNPDMTTDLDCNMAHVQPDGPLPEDNQRRAVTSGPPPPELGHYHYHALPTGLYELEGGTYPWNERPEPSIMTRPVVQLGWAWDGVPIYGPTCWRPNPSAPSNWWKPTSQWALRTGNRGRDAPCGKFNGDYHSDYELGTGDLDECNGHETVLPGSGGRVYHYHITEEYPYIPLCWTRRPFNRAGDQQELLDRTDGRWGPVVGGS